MPIYEFRCKQCGDTTSLLWRSDSSLDELTCRRCGHPELEKLISAFSVHKSLSSKLASLDPKYDKMVDTAVRNTPELDPDVHLKKMKPFSDGR